MLSYRYIIKCHEDAFEYIQRHQSYLTKEDLEVFRRGDGVEAITFVQHVGDVVIKPTCVSHQVLNVNSTIKMTMDFVSPYDALQCLQNLERIKTVPKRDDYIGVKRALHLVDLADQERTFVCFSISRISISFSIMYFRRKSTCTCTFLMRRKYIFTYRCKEL